MKRNVIYKEYICPSAQVIEMMPEGNILVFSGGEASGDAGGESGWDE